MRWNSARGIEVDASPLFSVKRSCLKLLSILKSRPCFCIFWIKSILRISFQLEAVLPSLIRLVMYSAAKVTIKECTYDLLGVSS